MAFTVNVITFSGGTVSPESAAEAAREMGTVRTALLEALPLVAALDRIVAALDRRQRPDDEAPYSPLHTLMSLGIESAERVQSVLRGAAG
jgi:hypothetical protein